MEVCADEHRKFLRSRGSFLRRPPHRDGQVRQVQVPPTADLRPRHERWLDGEGEKGRKVSMDTVWKSVGEVISSVDWSAVAVETCNTGGLLTFTVIILSMVAVVCDNLDLG